MDKAAQIHCSWFLDSQWVVKSGHEDGEWAQKLNHKCQSFCSGTHVGLVDRYDREAVNE